MGGKEGEARRRGWEEGKGRSRGSGRRGMGGRGEGKRRGEEEGGGGEGREKKKKKNDNIRRCLRKCIDTTLKLSVLTQIPGRIITFGRLVPGGRRLVLF